MKKKIFGYKLSRGQGARKALFRSLTKALIEHGSIETTLTKAYAVRPNIVKLVKLSKKGDLASKRKVYSILGNDRGAADKLHEITKSFGDLTAGFTRIKEVRVRKGDRAKIVNLSWSVEMKETSKDKKGKADKSSVQATESKRGLKKIKEKLTGKKK